MSPNLRRVDKHSLRINLIIIRQYRYFVDKTQNRSGYRYRGLCVKAFTVCSPYQIGNKIVFLSHWNSVVDNIVVAQLKIDVRLATKLRIDYDTTFEKITDDDGTTSTTACVHLWFFDRICYDIAYKSRCL